MKTHCNSPVGNARRTTKAFPGQQPDAVVNGASVDQRRSGTVVDFLSLRRAAGFALGSTLAFALAFFLFSDRLPTAVVQPRFVRFNVQVDF